MNAWACSMSFLVLVSLPIHAVAADCPPTDYDRERLEALRSASFVIDRADSRNSFALAIAGCLASPDPFLRDEIAFEGLSRWLRSGQLSVATRLRLTIAMKQQLTNEDVDGFARPFAALTLSELIRADRHNPYLDQVERAALLDRGIEYFLSVRDYRGFDAQEGWRHGVAHGADLLTQFALDPCLPRGDLLRIRDAIAMQVAPQDHFYIYGESERLAQAILAIAQRGVITEEEWQQYFAQFTHQDNVFHSQRGLAWRHNVSMFLEVVWISAKLDHDTTDDSVLTGAEMALRAIP